MVKGWVIFFAFLIIFPVINATSFGYGNLGNSVSVTTSNNYFNGSNINATTTTCSGTDKFSAYNNATGAFTCSTDEDSGSAVTWADIGNGTVVFATTLNNGTYITFGILNNGTYTNDPNTVLWADVNNGTISATDATWLANWTVYNTTWSTDTDTFVANYSSFLDVQSLVTNNTFALFSVLNNGTYTNYLWNSTNDTYNAFLTNDTFAQLSILNNGTYSQSGSANWDNNYSQFLINTALVTNGTFQPLGNYLTEETNWNNNYTDFLNKVSWSDVNNGTISGTDATWLSNWTAYNTTWSTDTDTFVANYSAFLNKVNWADVNNGTISGTDATWLSNWTAYNTTWSSTTNTSYLLNSGDTATGNYTFDSGTLFIDSTNHKIGIGTTTPQDALQLYGTNHLSVGPTAAGTTYNVRISEVGIPIFAQTGWVSGDNDGPYWYTQRSRGDSDGNYTIVRDGDVLGQFYFLGSDGTTFRTGAAFRASVDGVPGAGSMPGRLQFYTTPNGSAAALERLRIDSSGRVGINTTSPQNTLNVVGDINSTGTIYALGQNLSALSSSEPNWNANYSLVVPYTVLNNGTYSQQDTDTFVANYSDFLNKVDWIDVNNGTITGNPNTVLWGDANNGTIFDINKVEWGDVGNGTLATLSSVWATLSNGTLVLYTTLNNGSYFNPDLTNYIQQSQLNNGTYFLTSQWNSTNATYNSFLTNGTFQLAGSSEPNWNANYSDFLATYGLTTNNTFAQLTILNNGTYSAVDTDTFVANYSDFLNKVDWADVNNGTITASEALWNANYSDFLTTQNLASTWLSNWTAYNTTWSLDTDTFVTNYSSFLTTQSLANTWLANWTAYNTTWSTDTDTFVANYSQFLTNTAITTNGTFASTTYVDTQNTSQTNYINVQNTSVTNALNTKRATTNYTFTTGNGAVNLTGSTNLSLNQGSFICLNYGCSQWIKSNVTGVFIQG